MVEEKGRQREKDPWYSDSGIPEKMELRELDHGHVGQKGLLSPGSEDLATWQGQMDPWFGSK